ncbi:thiopeptide maturation pyridine synthase [Streptomyces sp. SudanB182_2057]|uniref:thiopeptide maturation pyridine synthase n=1 Tax=Streptomyces sp. SudanB182_2057 TaxID=3035281 RepID=UPI003F550E84
MNGAAGSRWYSLHVHHHDEEAEPELVLRAVRPAFEAVAPWVEGAWFGRHWLRGPHLRLNFRCRDTEWEERVRPTVTRIVTDYLRARPSVARLDEGALAPVHARLAELEMETGPRHPWVPDNTVLERPYDHRLPVLESLRASELLADFLSDTNDQAFRAYERVRAGGALSLLALDLMWTTASVAAVPFIAGGEPIERGFLSLRSHADAFLSRTRDPAAVRADFDDRFRRQETVLCERLRSVEAALGDEARATKDPGRSDAVGDVVPFVTEWAAAVRRHQRIAHPLLASGEVSMGGAARAPRLPTRRTSEFHAVLRSDHGHEDFVRTDDWFASFRLVMNYLYLHLTRLGLKPVDRALLCHLAALTVEAVHGVDAVGSFQRYVASVDPSSKRPEWRRIGEAWAAGGAG